MKRMLFICLAVVLLSGGIGGIVYAQGEHEPMLGNKLVGDGTFGEYTPPPNYDVDNLLFAAISNPDCVGEITVDRVSVIRGDGAVIYEGPPIRLVRDSSGEVIEEVPVDPLGPHRNYLIRLFEFMKDPDAADPDRWLTIPEAHSLPARRYTVEFFYTAPRRCLPPLGWVGQHRIMNFDDGQKAHAWDRSYMVDLRQRLR